MPVMIGLTVMLPAAVHAASYEDPALHLRFTVPDDFKKVDSGGRDLFRFEKDLGDGSSMELTIQPMGRVLGREAPAVPPDALPGSGQVFLESGHYSPETFAWRSWGLNGLRMNGKAQGKEVLILTAQVPLVPEAIQIGVAGTGPHTQQVRAVLLSVLASVEGKTNWATLDERTQKVARLVVVLVGVVLSVLGVIWWNRRTPEARPGSAQNRRG